MRKHVTHARKPKYRTPDQQIREQDARRLEIMEQASLQSSSNNCDESVLLEALLIQEATERAKGDPERALMIFDTELEMIQQDQSRDAINEAIEAIQEIIAEVMADTDYRTAAVEQVGTV